MPVTAVTDIDFIQRNLMCVKFNQVVKANGPFFNKLNYGVDVGSGFIGFKSLNGGQPLIIDEIWPDIKNRTKATTNVAYLRVRGGTVGAKYQGIFQSIEGTTIIPALEAPPFLNPSFENGTGNVADNWTFEDTFAAFTNPGVPANFGRGAWTGNPTPPDVLGPGVSEPWVQDGSYSFALGDVFNLVLNDTVGRYVEVRQDIDLTAVSEIVFNYFWDIYLDAASPLHRFEVLIGPSFTQEFLEQATIDTLKYNQSIDVSSYTGVNTVRFRMTRQALDTITKFNEVVYLDNIRTVGYPVSTLMTADENTFIFEARRTKLDAIMRKVPHDWDTRIGSNVWTLLYAMANEDTRIGG